MHTYTARHVCLKETNPQVLFSIWCTLNAASAELAAGGSAPGDNVKRHPIVNDSAEINLTTVSAGIRSGCERE